MVSQDSDGRAFYAQPQPWGHLDGVPVYTHFGRGTMSLVFARGGRALWRPVSNEQVLRAAIKRLQTEVLAFKPVTAAPAAALYAQWLADAPQRKRQTEATLDAVRRGNPAGAEALRQEMARMHAEMEEGFRRDAEHEQVRLTQASQQQPKSRPMTVHDVLKRHQDWLVRLSPGQRAAQAISLRAELPDPSLAVVQAKRLRRDKSGTEGFVADHAYHPLGTHPAAAGTMTPNSATQYKKRFFSDCIVKIVCYYL